MKKICIFIVIIILFIISCLKLGTFFYKNQKLESPVRIVFVSDSLYVMPTRTVIKSIVANKNPSTQIEINVIGFKLKPASVNKLKNESRKNVKVNVIEGDINMISPDGTVTYNRLVPSYDYTKFYLPLIFKDYDKIIYLDGDVIVLKDLSELFNTDIEDKYLAAVDDWQTSWEPRRNERYFNNGVLLLNLKNMRKDNITEKLVEWKRNDKDNRFATQDAYNYVLSKKVKYLPLIYDTFAPEYDKSNILEKIKKVLWLSYDSSLYNYKTDDEYRNAVAIIHYCGWYNIKPWWIKADIFSDRLSSKIWYKYAPIEFWFKYISIKLIKNILSTLDE